MVLSVFNCSPQKSSLPAKMPDKFHIRYAENGGMSPYSLSILLSTDSCIFNHQTQESEQTKIEFEIERSKLDEIYQTCRMYNFDKLKNKKPAHITYDEGSEGIYLRAAGISHHVSSGANFPFQNKKHSGNYWKVKNKIFDVYTIARVSSQKNTYTIQLLDKISKLTTIGHEAVGVAGTKSEEYKLFESLEAELNENEWVALCQHSNPVVIGYSIWALLRKNSNKAIHLLIEKNNVKTEVKVANGCETDSIPLNNWLAQRFKACPLKDLSGDDQKRVAYYLERIKK